ESLAPGIEVDVLHAGDFAGFQIHIAADRLVDPLLGSGGNGGVSFGVDLEGSFVELFQIRGDVVDVVDFSAVGNDFVFDLVPDAERLEVIDQTLVEFEELAREGIAAEYVGEIRVNSGRGAGDQTDGGVGGDRHQV